MVKVLVSKQSSYGLDTAKLKKALSSFFEQRGIVSKAEVEVAIVGEKPMLALAKTYLKEKNTLHNVLSFTPEETQGRFINPPDGVIHLGEIIICYPKVREEASIEGVLIDEKVIELACHGAEHLMGIHHK